MKLKMIIGTLVATLSGAVFAAPTTTAFTNFMNNVSSDVSQVNNAQAAQNSSYNEFNRQLVYTAKGNGNSSTMVSFLNAYEAKSFPHLMKANQAILNIKPGASRSEVAQNLALAKSEIEQYQNTRMELFSDSGNNQGGYFVVNREANLFLCTYENSEVQKGKGLFKWIKTVVNSTKVADCIVSHEANTSKDLDKKAQVYAATVGAVSSVANVFLANATYFSEDQFTNRVSEFVVAQKADTKSDVRRVIDTNINNSTCEAAMDNFRDGFNNSMGDNPKLKSLLLASQPGSKVRSALNIFGADKNNIIGDALNITYVSLTGKKLEDTSRDYDVCDYKLYEKNKANNVYLSRMIDFGEISKKTNGVLSPEQVYQLFVISSAKATSMVVADKNSGALRMFN
ncbi:hypothetical protein [Aquella oligotrophica]|uniref:Uncharacterized protein n=1 Tax=Aquella oligotrophica TaxID=2067065 RepID=A0A2I7N4T1_9NEIS|nr:hypothetical protein [Aquella oligotrophica]AUR51477.1 hypothetical protein CUN60_03955 [Aquella oligotrophica]